MEGGNIVMAPYYSGIMLQGITGVVCGKKDWPLFIVYGICAQTVYCEYGSSIYWTN